MHDLRLTGRTAGARDRAVPDRLRARRTDPASGGRPHRARCGRRDGDGLRRVRWPGDRGLGVQRLGVQRLGDQRPVDQRSGGRRLGVQCSGGRRSRGRQQAGRCLGGRRPGGRRPGGQRWGDRRTGDHRSRVFARARPPVSARRRSPLAMAAYDALRMLSVRARGIVRHIAVAFGLRTALSTVRPLFAGRFTTHIGHTPRALTGTSHRTDAFRFERGIGTIAATAILTPSGPARTAADPAANIRESLFMIGTAPAALARADRRGPRRPLGRAGRVRRGPRCSQGVHRDARCRGEVARDHGRSTGRPGGSPGLDDRDPVVTGRPPVWPNRWANRVAALDVGVLSAGHDSANGAVPTVP